MRRTLDVGFGNFVMVNKIIRIVSVNPEKVKKILKNNFFETIINVTGGMKPESLIEMEGGYLILTAVSKQQLLEELAL
jgi:regulator of extracellular matrix RemA (YlzA/DUF370 family)